MHRISLTLVLYVRMYGGSVLRRIPRWSEARIPWSPFYLILQFPLNSDGKADNTYPTVFRKAVKVQKMRQNKCMEIARLPAI